VRIENSSRSNRSDNSNPRALRPGTIDQLRYRARLEVDQVAVVRSEDAEPERGRFDPELVLWTIHRGASCRVDMTHQWDFWPLATLEVDEARRRIGLLPPFPNPVSA
jgi:hypothetical protein